MQLSCLVLLLLFCSIAFAGQATISITDSGSPNYHTHNTGKTFSLTVTATYSASNNDKVTYQWQDFKKVALTSPVALNSGAATVITSPSSQAGYYALVFAAGPSITLPRRSAGETLSWGFAIADPRGSSVQAGSYFGTVRSDYNDPYMPTWVKVIWSPGANAADWDYTLKDELTKGKLELGIYTGVSAESQTNWATSPNDNSVISQTQLNAIQADAKKYSKAYVNTPANQYIELGIEENLYAIYDQSQYFSNLAKKIQAWRAGAVSAGATNLKFVYQYVVDKNADSGLQALINSVAMPQIDVLSLHMYPWTDFPYPDTWLIAAVQQTQTWMNSKGVVRPIWYTECGNPFNDPYVDGYQDGGAVTGATTTRAAIYMARLYALSLSVGVKKVFWYQYQDQNFDRYDAEANFGMRTVDGYLQPTYSVMINQQNKIDGTTFVGRTSIGAITNVHFQATGKDVYVLWHPTSTSTTNVALSSIGSGMTSSNTLAYDVVGHPITVTTTVPVADAPVYIVTTAGGNPGTVGPTAAPSPSCTIVTGSPSGTITTSGGNTWRINSGGVIEVNGNPDGDTMNVLALAYVSGKLWQKNINNDWYYKTVPSDAWSAATSTDPTTSCSATQKPTTKPTSAPTSAPTPAPTAAPSAPCTIVSGAPSATITTSGGNTWSINSAKVIVVNGGADGTTMNVLQLAYVGGKLWQKNINNVWYYKTVPADAWSSGTTTDPTAVCYAITIFEDSLISGATVDTPSSTYAVVSSQAYSGSKSMSVNFQAWGVFEIDLASPISVGPNKYLTLVMKGASSSVGVHIQAWVGQWNDNIPWVDLSPKPTTAWKVYNIPLSSLQITTQIESIALQLTEGTAFNSYIDHILLTA